jgi:hypothetical protein
MVVLRRNRPQQHRATSMKVVEITLTGVSSPGGRCFSAAVD